jgi:hypothetical protein
MNQIGLWFENKPFGNTAQLSPWSLTASTVAAVKILKSSSPLFSMFTILIQGNFCAY